MTILRIKKMLELKDSIEATKQATKACLQQVEGIGLDNRGAGVH